MNRHTATNWIDKQRPVMYGLTRRDGRPAITIDDSLVVERVVVLDGASEADAMLILNALRATRCREHGHSWVGTGDERVVCDDCGIERSGQPVRMAPHPEGDRMSDTPRTDAFIAEFGGYSPDVDRFSELANLARQLERELHGVIVTP